MISELRVPAPVRQRSVEFGRKKPSSAPSHHHRQCVFFRTLLSQPTYQNDNCIYLDFRIKINNNNNNISNSSSNNSSNIIIVIMIMIIIIIIIII
jgi:hypothetical protein